MKSVIVKTLPVIEFLYLPILVLSAVVLKIYRRVGSKRLSLSTKMLKMIGVFPVIDHYYEPLFNDSRIPNDLNADRNLPGIDFNIGGQLDLLKNLRFQNEFSEFLGNEKEVQSQYAFQIDNMSFGSGDAEFLFNFVRYTKPKRVIEIGCGESTKIIRGALNLNRGGSSENSYHACIEPYEQPWLDGVSEIDLIRKKVEDVDLSEFQSLESGDFLFIDSSHMIRPQGDVLYEFLTIIPSLQSGVSVHVHDIFSPRDYLNDWVSKDVRFWNEQYLLEALLTKSNSYEVLAALNLLKTRYYEELKEVSPYLTPDREPGSFYFKTL